MCETMGHPAPEFDPGRRLFRSPDAFRKWSSKCVPFQTSKVSPTATPRLVFPRQESDDLGHPRRRRVRHSLDQPRNRTASTERAALLAYAASLRCCLPAADGTACSTAPFRTQELRKASRRAAAVLRPDPRRSSDSLSCTPLVMRAHRNRPLSSIEPLPTGRPNDSQTPHESDATPAPRTSVPMGVGPPR